MTRKLLSFILLGILAVGLQACSQKPEPERACNFVQNSEQQRVSWGASTPVVLYIDSSVPSAFYDAIGAAIHDWNTAVGRVVLKLGGRIETNGQPSQDGANVIYYLKTWESERANEQARTTVYWAGDRIYEADIRINSLNHDFFWGSEPVSGKVDMQSLMLHEYGHVLGLGHTAEPESVMVKSLASATLRRQLSQMDLGSIRCEY